MFSQWLHRLARHVPSACQVCGSFGVQAVCPDCMSRWATPRWRCITCATALPSITAAPASEPRCGACLRDGSALDACHAAVDYAYPWNQLLMRFKYPDGGLSRAQPALAHALAQVMRAVSAQDAQFGLALQEASHCNYLIPVPLHPERLAQRGFNQAQQLAQALWPQAANIRTDLLLRIKNTAIQANLPRAQRSANLRQAFVAAPLRARELQGRSVCLIDDVSTTGATLNSAAQALRQAGAHHVRAIVFARTDALAE